MLLGSGEKERLRGHTSNFGIRELTVQVEKVLQSLVELGNK